MLTDKRRDVVASIEKVSLSKFLKNINATVDGIITGKGKVIGIGSVSCRVMFWLE